MTVLLSRTLCALLVAAVPLVAGAQGFPSKPVRVVIPFTPGGPNDLVARPLAQRVSELWTRPVVVENVPGANAIIGTEQVARSTADGHTVLIVSTAFTINPSVVAKLNYDPIRDFAPVSLIANSDIVLASHPRVPAKTIRELIALAKAQPVKLTYGSSGTGNSTHLGGELFDMMAGVKMVHVPYKGAAPALNDLLGGHIDLIFTAIPPALGHMQAGRVRALGVASSKRSFALPAVPTIEEQGLRGFEVTSRYGMVAPAGTPRDIVARWHDAVTKVLHTPDMKTLYNGYGVEPYTNTPEEFGAYLKRELEKWRKVARAAGLGKE
ncbi:MAG: Bug family tripartite tricarboxylate transporter substrate binding protein [Rhodospirillaceae bacterium]